MLVQEKVPGGKLVCIEAITTEGRIEKIRITGDFFLHPEETIEKIEQVLVNRRADADFVGIISRALSDNNALLIGATPEDLQRLIRRAMA